MSVVVSADLRKHFGVARDQRQRPTCLAFAASDAHAATRTPWDPLSCEYLFYKAQTTSGRPPTRGALVSSVLDTLRDHGQPLETDWPYFLATPDPAVWLPPANLGTLFKRSSQRLQNFAFDDICLMIDQGKPVIVLCRISHAFYKPQADGLIAPAPGEKPDPARRHAIIAVGHGAVGTTRYLLLRNSWGANWGMAGHGWIPKDYFNAAIFAAVTL